MVLDNFGLVNWFDTDTVEYPSEFKIHFRDSKGFFPLFLPPSTNNSPGPWLAPPISPLIQNSMESQFPPSYL